MTAESNYRRRGTGKGLTFLSEALRTETDDCILWPMYRMRNGYGQVGTHKGMMLAHRFVCAEAHGPAPFPKAEVAHSCGNRACVNKRHLRWATSSENERDKHAHGTWMSRMGGAKLTERDVLKIRALAATGMRNKQIAATTGTPVRTVRHVVGGNTWKHIQVAA